MKYLNRYRDPWEKCRKPFQLAEKIFQNISDGHYLASSGLNIHFLNKKIKLGESKTSFLNNYNKEAFYNIINVKENYDISNKNIIFDYW